MNSAQSQYWRRPLRLVSRYWKNSNERRTLLGKLRDALSERRLLPQAIWRIFNVWQIYTKIISNKFDFAGLYSVRYDFNDFCSHNKLNRDRSKFKKFEKYLTPFIWNYENLRYFACIVWKWFTLNVYNVNKCNSEVQIFFTIVFLEQKVLIGFIEDVKSF